MININLPIELELAFVSGWGDAPANPSHKLMSASVYIRKHEECEAKWKKSGARAVVTNNMLCAGGAHDACHGDSGGPLTCTKSLPNSGKQRHLCGIVSKGANCSIPLTTKKAYPGVYTDVSKYGEWISRQITAWGIHSFDNNDAIYQSLKTHFQT